MPKPKIITHVQMGLAIFFIILCLLFPFFYQNLTQGFRLNKLCQVGKAPEFHIEKTEQATALLNQPFDYFGKGLQCFVFKSKDDQVVLKLFKRPKNKHGLQRMEKTFQAAILAFREAREETGLLYIHFHATQGEEPTILLKNHLGFSFLLPLDSYAFILQKKVDPFKKTLLEALVNGSADPLIDSYLNLIDKRSNKGICNTDLMLKTNFGFLENQAFEIDFGNYIYAPEQREKEFFLFVDRMRHFLKVQAPAYVHRYEEKVKLFLMEKEACETKHCE